MDLSRLQRSAQAGLGPGSAAMTAPKTADRRCTVPIYTGNNISRAQAFVPSPQKTRHAARVEPIAAASPQQSPAAQQQQQQQQQQRRAVYVEIPASQEDAVRGTKPWLGLRYQAVWRGCCVRGSGSGASGSAAAAWRGQ